MVLQSVPNEGRGGKSDAGQGLQLNAVSRIEEAYRPLKSFQDILLHSTDDGAIPHDGWFCHIGDVLGVLIDHTEKEVREVTEYLAARGGTGEHHE